MIVLVPSRKHYYYYYENLPVKTDIDSALFLKNLNFAKLGLKKFPNSIDLMNELGFESSNLPSLPDVTQNEYVIYNLIKTYCLN